MADTLNLKKLVGPSAKLATAIGGIMADGQVTLGDMRHVPSLFAALRGFAGLDFAAVLPEVKDLSDAERDELVAVFRNSFDISSDSTEHAIEEGFALVMMALQAVTTFVTLETKVKK